jgi:hypothetical protein
VFDIAFCIGKTPPWRQRVSIALPTLVVFLLYAGSIRKRMFVKQRKLTREKLNAF